MTKPLTRTQADEMAALIADADCAVDALTAGRRKSGSEFNERIRKLQHLKAFLHNARTSRTGELFEMGSVVSPELARLLADPMHGL